jgi:hypothetical protein
VDRPGDGQRDTGRVEDVAGGAVTVSWRGTPDVSATPAAASGLNWRAAVLVKIREPASRIAIARMAYRLERKLFRRSSRLGFSSRTTACSSSWRSKMKYGSWLFRRRAIGCPP